VLAWCLGGRAVEGRVVGEMEDYFEEELEGLLRLFGRRNKNSIFAHAKRRVSEIRIDRLCRARLMYVADPKFPMDRSGDEIERI
jgi:hypothetical protein